MRRRLLLWLVLIAVAGFIPRPGCGTATNCDINCRAYGFYSASAVIARMVPCCTGIAIFPPRVQIEAPAWGFGEPYFKRGFTKYKEAAGNTGQRCSWFVGASLNVAEVIKNLFDEPESFAARAWQQPFIYNHLPLGLTIDVGLDD